MKHIAEFPADVELLAEHMQMRRHHDAEKRASDHLTGMMKQITTLRSVDEEVAAQWVVSKTDLSIEEVVRAKRYDSEAPWHLLSHGTGLSLTTKLPQELAAIELFKRFADACFEKSGSSLACVKQKGIYDTSTGKLNWHGVVFELKFGDDDTLAEVLHVNSSVKGTIPKGAHVTKDYAFQNFWTEGDASLRLKPFPALRLASFFDSDAFGHNIGGNSKKKTQSHLHDLVKAEEQKWTNCLAAARAPVAKVSADDVHTHLADFKADKRKQTVKAAHDKATIALATSASKKQIQFDA